jgi:transcriptional regulator with XRE-family HTH domain
MRSDGRGAGAATGLHGENSLVYDAFQRFLHNLPISYTDLAGAVGVSQPAVSRWASDVTHPSLGEMSTAVDVVRARIHESQRETERFSELLRLIEEAMRLYELEVEGRADAPTSIGISSASPNDSARSSAWPPESRGRNHLAAHPSRTRTELSSLLACFNTFGVMHFRH